MEEPSTTAQLKQFAAHVDEWHTKKKKKTKGIGKE